jgi:hypothetical protein
MGDGSAAQSRRQGDGEVWEMKHIVSFSGGMGSFAEAVACVQKFGRENVTLLFADTNIEDEDLHRFKNDTVSLLGCELVELNNGKTPFDVFVNVKLMGNTRIDPCSLHLKRIPLNNWFTERFAPDEAHMHLGIDYTEAHRLEGVKNRMLPYVYRSTLIEDERIVAKNFSAQFGIRPPRLYDWKLGHNNCGGFCVKAGLGHYKALHAAAPDRYLAFEKAEADVYAKIGKSHPFLRKKEGGVLKYITLQEYRERYLETGDVTASESLDFGGCGCAV